MPSKSNMGETGGMIHPEGKFLSSCEPVKPFKLCALTHNTGTGIRDIATPKGRNRNKGRSDGFQASPKPGKTNVIRS